MVLRERNKNAQALGSAPGTEAIVKRGMSFILGEYFHPKRKKTTLAEYGGGIY